MPSRWLHERKTEHYYNKAKVEGYRSRASYKLKQLNDEFKFFDGAKRVLDLGAAPGGWLQVAGESIEGGLVLGVDLKEIDDLYMENVETIVGDVRDPAVQEGILTVCQNLLKQQVAGLISANYQLVTLLSRQKR